MDERGDNDREGENRPKAKQTRLGTHVVPEPVVALIPSGCVASISDAETMRRQEPDVQATEDRPSTAQERLSTILGKDRGPVDCQRNDSSPSGLVCSNAEEVAHEPNHEERQNVATTVERKHNGHDEHQGDGGNKRRRAFRKATSDTE